MAEDSQSRRDAEGHKRQISRRARLPRSKTKLQPPLTPMIDVTFQLLLFFLLTTTFRQQEGQLPGTLPQIGGITAGQVVELQPIRIMLHPVGADRAGCIYEVSGLAVAIDSPDQLYQAMIARQKAVGSDEIPIIIQPRIDVRWRYVVEAFNQAIHAKFKNIGFASSR